MKKLKSLKGILSDIDGTLFFKGKPTKGAINAVSELRKRGFNLLFFTNTDSKTPETIFKNLQGLGFTIFKEEIFTPIIALKEFLSKYPDKKLFLVTTEEVKNEFKEYNQIKGSEKPDFVIIGDFRDNWDVNRLNQAFKFVLKGAELLGTQGNNYFLDQKGEPVIDTGSFVQMIAKTANVNSRIFGKPSKEYFDQAIRRINLNNKELIVIGDDIESDIKGAINANLKAILVETGKGQFYKPENAEIKPDIILKTFASILEYI
ncbi:MAG: HAD-IIA family hydrolase [Candidatus Thorarchaeota archaeon]